MYDPKPADIVLLAAVKAFEKTLKDFSLKPGQHPIDESFHVQITGVIEKEKDCDYEGKAVVNMPLLITLLCKRAKLARSDSKKIIMECAKLAINLAGEPLDTPGFADRLRDAEDAINAAIAAAPKIPKSRAGATKWLGTCAIERAH